MGVRSDIYILLQTELKNEQHFKQTIKQSILKNMDNYNYNELIKEFYKTENENIIEFLFFEECVKLEFYDYQSLFADLIDSNDQNPDSKIYYSMQELCTDFIEDSSFGETESNKNEDFLNEKEMSDDILYNSIRINCIFEGIPETNEFKLIDWIKED